MGFLVFKVPPLTEEEQEEPPAGGTILGDKGNLGRILHPPQVVQTS